MKLKKKFRSTIIANIIGLLLVCVLYYTLKNHHGYSFSFNMLQSNYKSISKYKNISLDNRYSIKLGRSYELFKFIASSTPTDAVIYLPGERAFKIKSNDVVFNGEPYNKGWATRFLHPRKIVLESEYDTSIYSKEITHIVNINGIGAEKSPHKLKNPPLFGIISVKQSKPINNTGVKKDSTNIKIN